MARYVSPGSQIERLFIDTLVPISPYPPLTADLREELISQTGFLWITTFSLPDTQNKPALVLQLFFPLPQ